MHFHLRTIDDKFEIERTQRPGAGFPLFSSTVDSDVTITSYIFVAHNYQ